MSPSIIPTKIMVFLGKWHVRSKIVLQDTVLEHVLHFSCLGATKLYDLVEEMTT